MLKLGVNIDHVATVREARYRGRERGEPDPVAAAAACEAAGAHGITAHLREDRRHMQDRDVWRLREVVRTRLNLEMANAPEIVVIALKLKPDIVCLVPERRQEVTTEGGLNAAGNVPALTETRKRMNDGGIEVSLFIAPDPAQVEAAARIASLELADIDVRVNMVSPDAVFGDANRKSGGWKAVGPDRMRARGLDEAGLEEYYRTRNLLKARVTVDHVANAVLFFATRQTPTTGATIPVDGGLPDATPR